MSRCGLGLVVAYGACLFACVGDPPSTSPAPSSDGGIPNPGTGDGSPTSDGGTTGEDAAPPAPPCDLDAPFGAPVLVPGIDSPQDDRDARLSTDELSIFFASTRPDGGNQNARDIYTASRKVRTEPFTSVTPVDGLALADVADSAPMLAPDGLTLFFESTRTGSTKHDIWIATRTESSPFTNFTRLAVLDDGSDDRTPYFSAAEDALWFASDRGTSPPRYKLYRAKRNAAGGFEAPVRVDELNGSADDTSWYPVLSADGLTIYWTSQRAGTHGDYDIWRARRRELSDPFGNVENVTELNTPAADVPTWLSPDGCRLYLLRNESTQPASIYVAEKPPKN